MSIENMNHKSTNPKFSKLHAKFQDDIVITYSWSSSSHGICGHNFEAFELLHTLLQSNTNEGKVKILIPETDQVTNNVKEALQSKYQNYNNYKDYILNAKPEILTAKTVVLCDGQLPTKGTINAQKLVLILCSKDIKVTNISMFTGNLLEIWYDERLDYSVTSIVHTINQLRPDIKITIRSNYIKKINFSLYKTQTYVKQEFIHKYLVYVTGNCRDMYHADRKYQSDTLKEIKDIIFAQKEILKFGQHEILIVGWNPEYNIEEKIYFNSHHDQKIFEDRKRASKMASDLTEYFDGEVIIVPECDLPLDNIFNEFDTYIYTPTSKNWDCSSRLIPECKFFNKEVILTKTSKLLLNENLALKIRIEDYYPSILR